MTITQTPLEKQVITLDLSNGMDERQRPELMGGVTLIENLVQDQTGAWVKRPGSTIGPISDGSGTGYWPASVKKILRLASGWAAIGDGGKLLHKQDGVSRLRQRERLVDFNVYQASFIGSAGSYSINNSSSVFAAASCSTHDAYVSSGQPTVTGGSIYHKLTVCERATGTEYCYNLGAISYPGTGGAGRDAKMCFVGDRYLHLYVSNNPGTSATDVSLIVIDVQSAMPATEAGILNVTNVANAGGGGLVCRDACGGASYSYVIVYDGAINVSVYQRSAATGAAYKTYNPAAGDTHACIGIDEDNSRVWLMVAGATAKFEAVSSVDITVSSVSIFTATKPGTYFAVNPVTGGLKVVYVTTATFGGTTIAETEILTLATAASSDLTVVGSFYGWTVVSKPFYISTQAKHYIQLTKVDANSALSSIVIADISNFTGYVSNSAGLAKPYGSVRVACNLEPYAGMQAFTSVLSYQSQDGSTFSAMVPYQTAQRTLGFAMCRLRPNDDTAYGSANFGGVAYVAHGGLSCYDGRNAYEQGMLDMPIMNNQTQAVAGNLNGAYKYVVVYRHVDANGNSTYSRTYGPVTASNTAANPGKNLLTIQPHAVTNRDDGKGNSVPFIEVYRTIAGGTQYFICASSAAGIAGSNIQQIAINATTGLATFTDNLADTSLDDLAIMYRQPGTTGAPADRYSSPAARFVIQHKDRLFCTDGYGQRVYYSSFFVDGEAAWFSPTFNFFIHAGTGPITGLASMDGRLFVFKKDAIFVVDGDGPGEAGPSGTEYSPPQSLASYYGCVDHRSIVVTPDGIIYRSPRGIEMITRNLQVKWIGDRVQDTCTSNPSTYGACIDQDSRVHILIGVSDPITGLYGVNGCELVYDLSEDCWSVFRYTGFEGTYGRARQHVALVNDSGTEKLVYADGYYATFSANSTSSVDYASYYSPFTIKSGWVKQAPLARQRVSEAMFLGIRDTNSVHALKMSLAFDYAASFTQTHTWQPVTLNSLALEELDIQPVKQQVLGIRIKIEDLEPDSVDIVSSSDTTPIVLTVASHDFIVGDDIIVAGHTVNVGANGTWVVGPVTSTTIELVGSIGSGAGDGGNDGTISYDVGNGKGCDILAVAFEVAPKLGAPKMAAGQKA